jgi:hypothetical protein
MSQKGTRPLSQRKPPGSGSFSFTPRNPLDVPESVKAACADAGLEYRWLDAKQMADRGNMHRMYWEIYKPEAEQIQKFKISGMAADGTIRSGTCILGVRPKNTGDGHRQLLKEKRVRLKEAIKAQNKEARRQAEKAGMRFQDETEVGEQTVVYDSDDQDE